jgi:hypothetical protein
MKGEQKKMFSDEARENVQNAVLAELANASKNYGKKYNSLHEGYAVLLEETEEAGDDMDYIKKNMGVLWQSIKTNDLKDTTLLTDIEGTAQMLALEAIQIAAVCAKFKRGM